MWQNNIEPASYILLILIAIALIAVSLSNRKMSPQTQRKAINEYEDFTYRCNLLISKINEVTDRLRENYFVSVADEERAISLIHQYQVLYNEIVYHNEKIGLYLERRSSKHYTQRKKEAEATLKKVEDVLHGLEDVEQYTITKEEWNYRQRIRKAEQFYKDYETYDHTDEYTQSDGSSEHEEQQNYYQERTTYGNDQRNNTHNSQREKSETSSFFGGCNTADEIEKRYKSLAKVYHPDMPNGDKETFQKLLEEYERKRRTV